MSKVGYEMHRFVRHFHFVVASVIVLIALNFFFQVSHAVPVRLPKHSSSHRLPKINDKHTLTLQTPLLQ